MYTILIKTTYPPYAIIGSQAWTMLSHKGTFPPLISKPPLKICTWNDSKEKTACKIVADNTKYKGPKP